MDREDEFEQFLGISTKETAGDMSSASHIPEKYSIYEASEYAGLTDIFDVVELKPSDTLVDFGCGLGRVLFYCNHRYMCGVTGVEYDRDIYDRLTQNAEYYHKRFLGQRRRFSLLHMKAEEYRIEPTDNFFYFFNPFSMDILEQVLDHIMISAGEHPRRITIILYYCTYDMMRIIRRYPFQLDHIIKLPSYNTDPDEKVYIYHYDQNK